MAALRGWLVMAILIGCIGSALPQMYFPDEEPQLIRPRSGGFRRGVSKVFRGGHGYGRSKSHYRGGGGGGAESKYRGGCDEMPQPPANSVIKCSTISGCRVSCMDGYALPDGERKLRLRCESGVWTPPEPWTDVPQCQASCDAPCQNGGSCLAPNVCSCPHGFSGAQCQVREPQCNAPRPSIMNSRSRCTDTRCSISCARGYETAAQRTNFELECSEQLGWTLAGQPDAAIPACEPICRPRCQNGGQCVAFNLCQCPKKFRGPACQWPAENCNPARRLEFNGAYNCSGRGDMFGCSLTCPEGVEFSSPPAAVYQCDYSTGVYSPQPIPQCQHAYEVVAPVDAVFNIPRVAPEQRLCQIWGGKHVSTFDGFGFSFEGGCSLTAVRDAANALFQVSVTRSCARRDCPLSVQFSADRQRLTLAVGADGSLSAKQSTVGSGADPEDLSLPGNVGSIDVDKEGHHIVATATTLGIKVFFSRDGLAIESEPSNWGSLSGICGNMDGVPQNDVLAGGLLNTLLEYHNSEPCASGSAPLSSVNCDQEARAAAIFRCRALLTETEGFAQCREVDGAAFVEACVADSCSGGEASALSGGYGSPAAGAHSADGESSTCATLAAFAAECQRKTGQTLSWRTMDLCPLSCPAGQIFSRCGARPADRCGGAVSDSWRCEEGCTCREGFLLDGERCVEPQQCSCVHNGVRHAAGDTVQQECNTCSCTGGRWTCTDLKCPSQCVVAGDPHYTTFDGVRFDFQGKCSYYLVQAAGFSVSAENVPCSGAISESMNYHPSTIPAQPSCTRSVQIVYNDVVVDLKQNLVVLVNGDVPPIVPWWVDGVYIKYASSSYLAVSLPNGLEVWWDGQTRAVLHASGEQTEPMAGLCGNNNNNQRDDFTTPEGDVETSAIAFASKWKVDETCDDATEEGNHPCRVYPEKFAEANQHCEIMRSNLFRDCHSLVDPTPYIKNCQYDVCSCRAELSDCFCVHVADYAEACAARGAVVAWRHEVGVCGVSCPFGQEYQVCGDSCAHTCFDLATDVACESRCVEGCQCPQGMTLDAEGYCTPVSSCPCVHNNKEYRPGHVRYDGAEAQLQQCECVNARWSCELAKTRRLAEDPSLQCDASQHLTYAECLPLQPRTCKNRHAQHPEGAKSRQYEACEPGCVCTAGYVLDVATGSCVRPEECPCHHGGETYTHGQSINTECRSCACESGTWACEEQECDGICTAWGNSHYQTFDGRVYDIEGDCQYMLAKGRLTAKNQFEIIVTNVLCGSGSTCPKAVSIHVGPAGGTETVTLEDGKPLPNASSLNRLAIRQAGAFAFVEAASLGLVVQWDFGTRISIRLTPTWKGKVQGLCGNFDSNPGDDFRGPNGLVENTAVQFAEQFKLKPYCPDTAETEDFCAVHPERHVFAVKKCAALQSPVFADCHGQVPVAPYLERCVSDTCACASGGDCECLCTAIAAYAQACSQKGVHIRWRSNELCPMQCDVKCSEYSACVDACPPKTCENRLVYDQTTSLCAEDSCVEGCAPHPCPSGEVYSNSSLTGCVREKDCKTPCVVIQDQQFFEGDIISKDDCHVCYCSRGGVKCLGSECPVVTSTPAPRTPDRPEPAPAPVDLQTCREGWSSWVNRNKPLPISRPNDVERIPTFIEPADQVDALIMVVDLVPGSNDQVKGRVTFVQKSAEQPLTISGEISGLSAGTHGFHIHAVGLTSDQCRDAGPHFNPVGLTHGSPSSVVRHTGDLGNIVADSSGLAMVNVVVPPEKTSLFGDHSIAGLTLVVHAGEDDLGRGGDDGSRATGNAGGRLACGVLTRAYDAGTGAAFCADNQVTNVRCRTAGTHLPISATGDQVTCTLHDGLVCLADHTCHDYELQVFCDCSIEPTGVPPTEPPPAPLPPSECKTDAWTPWMSSHTPAQGDWTDSEDARSLRAEHRFCADEYITAIECRTRGDHRDARAAGGGAICDLNHGLVCSDALGYCADFEVRFYCNCEETITTPKPRVTEAVEPCLQPMSAHETDCHKFYQCGPGAPKTEMSCGPTLWFNPRSMVCDFPDNVAPLRPECARAGPTTTPRPAETTTEGDHIHCDDIHPVREHESDCHKYYQCVRNANDELDEYLRTCGASMMYNPTTMTCDHIFNVLRIKPECGEEAVVTSAPTTELPATAVPCPLGQVYDDCQIRCDQLCHYYSSFLVSRGFCKVRDACKPGCRDESVSYQGCPAGYVWREEDRCVKISDCNCRLPNGKSLGPGAVITEDDGCTRTQCVGNELVSDTSDCYTTAVPSTAVYYSPSTTPAPDATTAPTEPPAVTRRLPEVDQRECDMWGDWIDNNDINVGLYEVEMLPWWLDFCTQGHKTRIQCEEVGSGLPYDQTRDVGVTCDVNSGVTCVHAQQPAGRCSNYRVRYYCSCEPSTEPTTVVTAGTTPAPTTPIAETTTGVPVIVSTVLPPPHCDENQFIPLISGAEPVPEKLISASGELASVLPVDGPAYHGARLARISEDPKYAGQFWTPKTQNGDQYIQVDLGRVRPVYGVRLAGNKQQGAAVTQFKVLHSLDGSIYNYATNAMAQPASFYAEDPLGDAGTVVFPVPFEAQYIRVNPTDWQSRLATKLELYGCERLTTPVPTLPPSTTTTPEPRCLEPMGLESGLLDDSLIKVSSQISDERGAPALRPGAAGWIPKVSNKKQHITIDFTDERTLDAITTQGVSVPSDAAAYTPAALRYIGSYKVQYSSDGVNWIWVYNKSGRIKVFPGHTQNSALVSMQNVFDQPIRARHLRIVPETWSPDGIGATVEVHGCYQPYPEVAAPTTTTTEAPPLPLRDCTTCEGVPSDEHEGCDACRAGQWWDGERCLDGPALCPCFVDGIPHEVGSIFETSDCRECVCQIGGDEVCEPKTCPPCGGDLVSELGNNCACQCNPCPEGTRICPTSRTCLAEELWCDGVKQCPDDEGDECLPETTPPPTEPPTTTAPPTEPSTTPAPPILPQYCTLKGNTFKTFDHVEYKYQICHHTLVKEEGLWDVSVHRVCEGKECSRQIRINLLGETVTLMPGVGVEFGGFTYTMQQAAAIRSREGTFTIKPITPTTTLFSAPDIGFAVLINNIGNVVVGANKQHFGTLEGLCGNFDGNKYNDKRTPAGAAAESTEEFGDSWALMDEPQKCQPETCDHSKEAFAMCQKIRLQPFSRCHYAVQPESFISSCLETACACLDGGGDEHECRCRLLTDYVTECLSLDPSVELNTWRIKHDCPADCPAGEVFHDCYRPTCEPSCSQLEPCSTLPDLCFQGCYCPEGHVRDANQKCVPPTECRDCQCTSYPGGLFETFDKKERHLNTNCSYLAAGSADGQHDFKVLVDNGNCQTSYNQGLLCHDEVLIQWGDNTVTLKKTDTLVEVFVNGAMVEGFYHEYTWGSVSQPPQGSVLVSVTGLQLDVSLHPTSGALSIRLPSVMHGGGVNGVCGNCDQSYFDEAAEPPSMWLVDTEDPASCVEEQAECVPPPPEQDPCQKMLDDALFGSCNLLEDPQPFINACQRRFCDDETGTHDVCDELELYARVCYQRGLCVQWRSQEMCGIGADCPPTMVYRQCAGTCLKSCEKRDCPLLEQDGCFCPDGMVYEDGVCVNESRCMFCDEEGHRPGDEWEKDSCTSCLCQDNGNTLCKSVACPPEQVVVCGEDETVVEIDGTGTECCPPRRECRRLIITTTEPPPKPSYCPEVVEPACQASEGKVVEHMTVNGCPVAVCACIPADQCPDVEVRPLKPGENVLNRTDACCPYAEIVCDTDACPADPECPDGFLTETKRETEEDCCPERYCQQPAGTCLVRLDVAIDIRAITKEDAEGFVLKRAGEVWQDGYCDNCTCREVPDGEPRYQPVCHQLVCAQPSEADRDEYVFDDDLEDDDMCCPRQIRVACKDNDQEYRAGQVWSQLDDQGRPVDACVTWGCIAHEKYGVVKVSSVQKCQEDCGSGEEYVPAAPGSGDCCGRCERTKCVQGGVEHAEGDIWKSADGCTDYMCERDFFDNQLSVLSSSALCRDVSDCPPENLYTDETGCCQRCNRTDNCHVLVVPPEETVGMFKSDQCVNVDQVKGLIRCQGACDSMAFFDTDSGQITSGCKCCSVTSTRVMDVALNCQHVDSYGGTYNDTIFRSFVVPDGCACSACGAGGGAASASVGASDSASQFWQQSTGGDWDALPFPDGFPSDGDAELVEPFPGGNGVGARSSGPPSESEFFDLLLNAAQATGGGHADDIGDGEIH